MILIKDVTPSDLPVGACLYSTRFDKFVLIERNDPWEDTVLSNGDKIEAAQYLSFYGYALVPFFEVTRLKQTMPELFI